MEPPSLAFISTFWHPNVYDKESETGAKPGEVCISILHAPGEDELNPQEHAAERWLPTRDVPSIIISVISMLASPNFESPANITASVEWQKQPEAYEEKIKGLVERAMREVPDHVVIPHPDTDAAERKAAASRIKNQQMQFDESELLLDGGSEDEDALDFLVGSDESFHESDIEDNASHSEENVTQSSQVSQSESTSVSKEARIAKKSKKSPKDGASGTARKRTNKKGGKTEDSSARPGGDAERRRKSKKCAIM